MDDNRGREWTHDPGAPVSLFLARTTSDPPERVNGGRTRETSPREQRRKVYSNLEQEASSGREDLSAAEEFVFGRRKYLGMDEGEQPEKWTILDNSAAKHKLSIRPHRKHADSRQSSLPKRKEEGSKSERQHEVILDHSERSQRADILCKREAVVKELLETEDEFCRDLAFVVETYVKPSDRVSAPSVVRDNTEIIFSNLKLIADFHATVLNEGIKYYSDLPRMIGKTFLRLERDFDKHTAYCRDVPLAQEFLAKNPQAVEFLEELGQKSGDGKNILEYLKLPVQRINDYQVLLKDLVKYSEKLEENSSELKKALELMLAIPQRANDNKFLTNIEGFHGNIHNLGRLLHHDWFTIESGESAPKERYLFLFKGHIIVCKVKKISEDRSVFSLKDFISLSEIKIHDCPGSRSFEIVPIGGTHCIKVYARKDETKSSWLAEINKSLSSVLEHTQKCKALRLTDQPEGREIKESAQEENNRQEKLVKEEQKTMNRRYSTRKSVRSYEESYTISGAQETYIHSSSRSASKYSSASVYDSQSSACETYESSSFGVSKKSSSVAMAGDVLAVTSGDKPVFTRTITGLHLEPGDTAAFECQLESEARLTWLKDNKALEDKLADRVIRSSSDDGTHRLELQNVTEADTGTYTALAQNDSNFSTCTAHLLVEKVPPEEAERRKESAAPYFIVRLKDTELMKSTNFTFVVKVKGSPNPDVKFYKDDIPIRDGKYGIKINREKADVGFYELTIVDVQNHHAGTYTCKATNNLGEALCEATVVVTDEKVVFKGLENEALLTAGEKPSFTWFKDGKSFDPDERFKVLLGNEDDSLALIFQHVRPDDAGLYTCVASTTTGKISCSAELSVQGAVNALEREPEKPTISKAARPVEADVGGSAILEAKVSGFPRPNVTWYHDGQQIAPEGRYKFLYEDQETMTLVIKNLNPRDGGQYKIVAKNELGEDVTEVDLIVRGAPKIVKKLQDITVKEEERIEIESRVEGCPTPVVQWYKDGKEISESERIKIVHDSSSGHHRLLIEKASPQDEGSYSMVATNEVNRCSDFCQVKVRSSLRISKKMDKRVDVEEGEDIVFEVEVSGESSSEVKWMKDGVELKSGEKVVIRKNGNVHTLKIRRSDADDAGTYSVEVENSEGKVRDSGEAVVGTKRCAPSLKRGLQDATAKEGDTEVEFSVEVAAYPKPKIRWYLDEMEITEKRSEYTKVEAENNYKLIVKKVTTELKGTYKCKVENECGSVETTAKLTVHSKPVFVKFPEPTIAVDEGAELTLQIECSGCPEPEISWFKDGQEIQTDAHIRIKKDLHRSESYSMTLTLIKQSDGGNYEARATNCMGSATTKTYVQVFSMITETSGDDAEALFKDNRLERHPRDALSIEEKNQREEAEEENKEEEEEEGDTFEVKGKSQWRVEFPERFAQVLKVEEVEENNCEDEKASECQGIVEEFLEDEFSCEKLNVHRGISIVSVSDDEKPLSRNNSIGNLSEEKENIQAKLSSVEREPGEDKKRVSSHERDSVTATESEARELECQTMETSKTVTPIAAATKTTVEAGSMAAATMTTTTPLSSAMTAVSNQTTTNSDNDAGPGIEQDNVKEDAVINSLLKKIKHQRSVLEEILEKESEAHKGGKEELPRFTEGLKDLDCSEKESVTLKCVVVGIPEPDVSWMHNNKPVQADGLKVKIDKKARETGTKGEVEVTSQLTIDKARSEDGGSYAAKASNACGTTESTARLNVRLQEESQRPKIKSLKDVVTTLSGDATFEAKIESESTVSVTWMNKNEEVIEESDRIVIKVDEAQGVYIMKIKSTEAGDIGEYTLVASNEAGETRQKVQLSVHGEVPSFVKVVTDAEVAEGIDGDFLVRCNGIPKPQVKWSKDGNDLGTGDGRVRVETNAEGQVSSCLKIERFGAEDIGKYKVTATNIVGTAENEFEIKMSQTSPVFEKGLPRTLEVDDNIIDLKCKVSGSPKPTVKWSKDGAPLEAKDAVKVIQQSDGTLRLLIEDVTPDHSGRYTLEVENPNGKIMAHCAVSVLPKSSKPKFLESLKDASGVEGQPLRLQAQLISFPLPEIKWFKDGRPLKPSQGVQTFDPKTGKLELILNELKSENAGTYTVKAVNSIGEAAQEAKLVVTEGPQKPKFLSEPRPVEAVENSPVQFTVKATGNPKPAIKWSRQGKELEADGENIMVKEEPDGSVSLLLKKCSLEDAAGFVATAVNDLGEATCQAHLTVFRRKTEEEEEKAPSFVGPLNNVKIDEGNDFVLSATISGNPIPEISWEKDGVEILPGRHVLATCNGKEVKVEVKSCKVEDSGVYTCHLRNSRGTATSKGTVEVKKIFSEPVFEEKFKDMEQVAGETAAFVARIRGNPKPDIDWYFNGEPVKDGGKYRITSEGDVYKLLVKDCLGADGGLYRCSAHNRAGKAECVGHLRVVPKAKEEIETEPPYFLKKVSDCDVYKGMTGKFTACCAGSPMPDFEWYKDDEKLKPSNRIKMTAEDNGLLRLAISGVSDDDVGTYRLRISNLHGSAECSARLICDTLDKPPKKEVIGRRECEIKPLGLPTALTDRPIISRMTDRHLTLSWKPYVPTGMHPPVTYVVEMCALPDNNWFAARRGVRSCACDIRNLEPYRDYKFRIRVENKYGTSDPSPYAETFRQKIIPDLGKFELRRVPNSNFRPEGIPKDFDFDRPLHEGYKQAPEFLTQPEDVQYGLKNQNSSIYWYVYGYPKPTITYLFNGEPVEMGGRFDSSYTRNGLATLFINRMLDRDVGCYEAIACNEHGKATQKIRLEIGEHPVFIRRPEESHIMLRGSATLTVRVFGVPFPEVKWFKDWLPLAPSSRHKFHHPTPDTFTLTISDAIFKDEGLYSVVVSNLIGTVTSSAMLLVEEDEEVFGYVTYGKGRDIRPRREPYSNLYDIGDELGRGTQGITYHAVERRTGENYAAKFMHGKWKAKPFMMNELNVMNALNHNKLIRLHDAFEVNDLIVIIEELAGGGQLLEWLTKQTYTTEREIAKYIRQVLWGLDYMHSNGFAHLSLTVNDLLLSRADGDDLKICDFGLTRRITRGLTLNHGMPEFVAPEVVNGEEVGYSADMWSLGIITYIFISGFSPFKGSNDRETLTRIKEGKWEFREEYFKEISSEARDFISKLLAYRTEERMDVKSALKHPWLERADGPPIPEQRKIDTGNLRNYYSSLRSWYRNASCNPWYRRQPLSNAFTHPSKMVYPPGDYGDSEFTFEKKTKNSRERAPADEVNLPREPLDYEVGNFKSESQYQNGPDTYLLQLRDVDLPCRLRHYMKVAADRQQSYSTELPERHIDWKTPVIRERRKFMDIMDEEIDDERRARISQYGSEDVYSLRRLKHEIGCRSDGHAEAEAILEYKRDGRLPFFREKPANLPITPNESAEVSCLVVGEPAPIVQWFKNDLVLGETSRIQMTTNGKGSFVLKLNPVIRSDVGTYKAVAKNKVGQSTARLRLVLATVPLPPDPPQLLQASDTQILLEWIHETDHVFTPTVCYSLQYKRSDDTEWTCAADNILHEFWLLEGLVPATSYDFRLLSKNCAGWSVPGSPLSLVQTKESGVPKVHLSDAQRKIQAEAESEGTDPPPKVHLDYQVENSPVEWIAGVEFEENYQVEFEVWRGEFSSVVRASDKSTREQIAAKIFQVNSRTERLVAEEFDNIKSLKHERIVDLRCALRPAPNVAIFVMERLDGTDILSYFASRKEYNEDMIVTALTQVLDGLQYLHWRGICHLNIQPNNIVLCTARALQIKLVDFGSARKVSKLGTIVKVPHTDYSAPEILNDEAAFPQTDIWSLGAIAYVLLSGVSPFKGETDEETQENILFVRYRFEHLFKEITQEATRFLMQVFKRTPSKRPTVEECYESRWFLSSEFVIKKRQKACFPGAWLKEYNDIYHARKNDSQTPLI